MPIPRVATPLALLIACAAALGAAEKSGPPRIAGEDAGKADAKAAFARQLANATKPTGADPAFIGAYIWGGRADQNYRPFFQWELRLAGGSAAASGLRGRIATLGSSRQVLVQGDWKDWGSLAAGAPLDVDYRANCPNFPAYQVELQWSGGKETFVACDKGSVPVPLGAIGEQGYVVAVAANFELNEKAKSAVVTWTDWNLGGRTAKDVVQTIHLRDANLKELKAITFKPEGGELAPLAVKEQKTTLTNVPAFATLSISTEQADTSTGGAAADFTGAKDIEVAKVRADGGRLRARVRNGLDVDQDGLIVTITLLDKAGKALGAYDIQVGHLAKGGEQDVATDLGKIDSWAGIETSWRAAGGGPTASAKPAAPAPAPTSAPSSPGLPGAVTADGLTFTPVKLEKTAAGLLLSGSVRNGSGKDLSAVKLTITVTDSAKKSQELVWKAPSLAAGGDGTVAVACAVKDVSALAMSWKSGGVE
jgi:hypothetical protein